jgi:hypothetical protein
MKYLLPLLLFCNLAYAGSGIVYTSMPRDDQRVDDIIDEGANYQNATGVKRIINNIAESDVIWDLLDGTGKKFTLYNCTTSDEICVAQQARVSPDGTKVAWAVGYGDRLVPVRATNSQGYTKYPEINQLTHSKIWIYENPREGYPLGRTYAVPNHPEGAIDMMPYWIDNDTILFSSDRGNTYPPKNMYTFHEDPNQCRWPCTQNSQEYKHKSMQIWQMDIDGTNTKNLTPHAQMALSPMYTTDGRILWSELVMHAQKAYKRTPSNIWWIGGSDGLGRNQAFFLNVHHTLPLKSRDWLTDIGEGEHTSRMKAVRCMAEIERDRFVVTSYYRANHLGCMGNIYEYVLGDHTVEGCSTADCYPDTYFGGQTPGSGQFTKASIKALTPYSNDQDMNNRFYFQGPHGYPAPFYEDGWWMLTHGRGNCFNQTHAQFSNRKAMGGEPTCQKGIYKAQGQVTDPMEQLVPLAADEDFHFFDAWPVAPYSELYGQLLPTQPPENTDEGECVLNVVDIRKSELEPRREIQDYWAWEACTDQGCVADPNNARDYIAENIKFLTVQKVELWDIPFNTTEFSRSASNTGFKSTVEHMSAPMRRDGSVSMTVPCETPIKILGSDQNGLVIAHDDALHSLREGETRTCHGCHDGHSLERAAEFVHLDDSSQGTSLWQSLTGFFTGNPVMTEEMSESDTMPQLKYMTAAERFEGTLASKSGPFDGCYPWGLGCVDKDVGVTFYQDVYPVLQDNCYSCHRSWDTPTPYSAVSWGDYSRPCTSDFVCKFAHTSPLYTHCVGVEGHPGVEDPATCLPIGKWIDQGIFQ